MLRRHSGAVVAGLAVSEAVCKRRELWPGHLFAHVGIAVGAAVPVVFVEVDGAGDLAAGDEAYGVRAVVDVEHAHHTAVVSVASYGRPAFHIYEAAGDVRVACAQHTAKKLLHLKGGVAFVSEYQRGVHAAVGYLVVVSGGAFRPFAVASAEARKSSDTCVAACAGLAVIRCSGFRQTGCRKRYPGVRNCAVVHQSVLHPARQDPCKTVGVSAHGNVRAAYGKVRYLCAV